VVTPRHARTLATQLPAPDSDRAAGPPRAARLHDQFFDQLTTAAWRDGLLSINEMSGIVAIGALLDVHCDVVQRAMGGPAS
jgi:hypothetical protein